MTAELLHAQFNHRRAEMLKHLPQCTRSAPNAWAVIARIQLRMRRLPACEQRRRTLECAHA
eukprot:4575149-Pleurochrysis_carterae.AAC.1